MSIKVFTHTTFFISEKSIKSLNFNLFSSLKSTIKVFYINKMVSIFFSNKLNIIKRNRSFTTLIKFSSLLFNMSYLLTIKINCFLHIRNSLVNKSINFISFNNTVINHIFLESIRLNILSKHIISTTSSSI